MTLEEVLADPNKCNGIDCKRFETCARYEKDAKVAWHNHVCKFGAPTSQCAACWAPCFQYVNNGKNK